MHSGTTRNDLGGTASLQAWLVTHMVEQERTQTDLNPARAAVLHRIAQSLAHSIDTNVFMREALSELIELLQLTFAIVTQRERNELAPIASGAGLIDPTMRLALETVP